jgi:hypothetical protein
MNNKVLPGLYLLGKNFIVRKQLLSTENNVLTQMVVSLLFESLDVSNF